MVGLSLMMMDPLLLAQSLQAMEDYSGRVQESFLWLLGNGCLGVLRNAELAKDRGWKNLWVEPTQL